MDSSTPGLPVHHQLPESTKPMSIESVMPSNHLILCCPLLLLLSIFRYQGHVSKWLIYIIYIPIITLWGTDEKTEEINKLPMITKSSGRVRLWAWPPEPRDAALHHSVTLLPLIYMLLNNFNLYSKLSMTAQMTTWLWSICKVLNWYCPALLFILGGKSSLIFIPDQ